MTAAGSELAATGLALTIIETGSVPEAATAARNALAVGWALKDACYASWSTDPQRAAKSADAMQHFSAAVGIATADKVGSMSLAQEVDALVQWTAGIAHIIRGKMADAAICFDRAECIFRELGQHERATQTQVPKIMALSMLGRFDAAIVCAEETQRQFVAFGNVHGAAKVSLNLGALHVQLGNFTDAARHSREATVLFARVGDYQYSVTADSNMADALTSMGDFDEALRIYARARMRAQRHGFGVLLALIDESVALLQLARGKYREALAGMEASRRQYERLAMPQQSAIAEKQLADAYLELRLLPEAMVLFDEALTRFEGLDMPNPRAWTLLQRGRVAALMARPDEAEKFFAAASALFATQRTMAGESAVALSRAESALVAGSPTRAEGLAQSAAEGFLATNSSEGRFRADVVRAHAVLRIGNIKKAREIFASTLNAARGLRLLTIQVRCLTGLGEAALANGEKDSASDAFEKAIELFEGQRSALPGDELRSAFLTDHLRPYQELLRIALAAQANMAVPPADAARQVFYQLERIRARALGERLLQDPEHVEDDATRRLRERLNWLHLRLRRLEDEGEPSAPISNELRQTEVQLLEHTRRVRLSMPLPSGSLGAQKRAEVDELQRALGEDGALLEYGVLDDELFACIVTRECVSLHRRIASWSDVLEALRAARFQLETFRHGAAPVGIHIASLTARATARLTRLHALLWAPLADRLAHCACIVIVPHAQLGSAPFGALHDGTTFLAERSQLALAPSAQIALKGLTHQAAPPRNVVALGESSRLPHAAKEADFVTRLFAEGRALVGKDATTASLQRHAGDADVVHLACHANFRSDNPRFSALDLVDGPLTAELVESLRLRPGMVVLSACETGLADDSVGDEAVGLVRAFLVAGTSRVVASLWPVDDAVTATFMASFYGALISGSSAAAALQSAQLAVKSMHPHPFYWAAFGIHGGW